MNSMAMAISDGTYDFYGTFSFDPHFADGGTYECGNTQLGLDCPAGVKFCINNLGVTDNEISSNITEEPYGIAIGNIPDVPFVGELDYDGNGPVALTVDDTGNANVETTMDVSPPQGCGGACVSSYTTDKVAPGGSTGTVTGQIPYIEAHQPVDFADCPSLSAKGSYGSPAVTTEEATSEIINELGTNELSDTGVKLDGEGPYTLTLKAPHTLFRTAIGGITLSQDAMTIVTWEGTLCERTSPDTSCIPVEFGCPAEDD
jgi:hypothetical protein